MSRSRSNQPTRTKRNNTLTNKDPNQLAVTTRQYSGPIPHPSILEGFEKIVPGAAERILRMAEQDSEHQREVEILAITSTVKEIRRGQIFGLIAVLCAFIACIISLHLGSEKTAITIGGTTIVSLAVAFIRLCHRTVWNFLISCIFNDLAIQYGMPQNVAFQPIKRLDCIFPHSSVT